MQAIAPPADATPDELLLELMDLVALAFPEPLYQLRVDFRAAAGGSRPALTNLSGKAHAGQPKRPALGFDDPAVLASINDVIGDLADATERQGQVRVLDGHIEVEEDEDHARNVVLVRAAATGAAAGAVAGAVAGEVASDAAGEVAVMTRRYDASELRLLLWTGPLFARLNATEEREHQQRRFVQELLRTTRRFEIDMQRGSIAFAGDGGARVVRDFELIGSWSDDARRMLWGWANDQAPERLRRGVEQLRQRSTAWGLRALHEASFGCPEPCAERLARHAAVELGFSGVYRAPFSSKHGSGYQYLALR